MKPFEVGDRVRGFFEDDEQLEGKIVEIDFLLNRVRVEYIAGSEDGNTEWFKDGDLKPYA
jgi:hypothetical protein